MRFFFQYKMLITVVSSPCKPNPCQNGGVCNRKGGSYTCTCAAGYQGNNCQTCKLSNQ